MATRGSNRSSPLLAIASLALLFWVPTQLWGHGSAATSFVPVRAAGQKVDASAPPLQADSRRVAVGAPLAALLAANGLASTEPAQAMFWEEEKAIYAKFKVALEGDKGGVEEVMVRLRPDWAPRGVKRFQQLVRIGQFEDTAVFHVDGETAHFGLPAEPTLSPVQIKDDLPRASNLRGTLSFASSGQHTRQEQLFFNLDDNKRLDNGYVPIGEVVEGMDAVDSLYGGYGRRPDKSQIFKEGNTYLDAEFPKLSKISSVEMM